MAAPNFITHTATAFNTTTTPKTASVAVQAGDVLVAFEITADSANAVGSTPTNDGAALTWTLQQSNVVTSPGNVGQSTWTAIADTTRTIVVTFAASPSTVIWGADVQVWRGASVGTSTKVTSGSGAPTLNITTTQANSAIIVSIGDWAAVVGAPTWRTNAGAFTSTVEQAGDGASYSARGGYHADAGAVGTYAVGVTAPAGETFSIIALEIKGVAGSPDVVLQMPTKKMGFRNSRGLAEPGGFNN